MREKRVLLLICLVLFFCASDSVFAETAVFPVESVRELPHDSESYTQGFFVEGDSFVESSGHYGRSWVQRYPIGERASAQSRRYLPKDIFAEGIAPFHNRILLLTWREGGYFLLDKQKLLPLERVAYPENWKIKEGWGVAKKGDTLAVSDGSERILLLDAETLALKRTFRVTDGGKAVSQLNELEFAGDILLANIWYSDRIAAIDVQTGKVIYWIDLSSLRSRLGEKSEVANGIAWDLVRKKLYVTGKNWDKTFEIRLPRQGSTRKR